MLDLLTNTVSLAILVSGVVFYLFGKWRGVQYAARTCSDALLDLLIEDGYLRYKTLENGEIKILKLDEDDNA